MFSAIRTVFNYFFSGEDTVTDSQWPDLVGEEKNEVFKTKNISGKVSNILGDQGLIDGQIYFSVSDVSGSATPQIGDEVSLTAVQQHENGGWYAENVTVVSKTWEDDDEDTPVNTNTAFVGKITIVKEDICVINSEVDFEKADCVDNYVPELGDWVTADCEILKVSEYEEKKVAYNVKPLRIWEFDGEVSAAMQDHGYVNGEVYFKYDVCINRHRPRKWDRVKVTAIESHQGKCSWRATRIVPCSSDESSRSQRSREPQCRPSGSEGWVIPGQRPQRLQAMIKLPNKLPQFPVADSLRDCVWAGQELTDHSPELAQVLTMQIYVRKFSVLLHLEEIQQEIDIRQFDLHRVCLRRYGEYLALHVPGLAEGRPSVLIGDKIILTDPGEPDGPCYEGFVHEIHSDEVLLKFSCEFHTRYNGEDYNVEFTFNRTSLRRCHQAVNLAVRHLKDAVLFPTSVSTKLPQIQLNKSKASPDVVKLQSCYTGFGSPDSSRSQSPQKATNADSGDRNSPQKATKADSGHSNSPQKVTKADSGHRNSPQKVTKADLGYRNSPQKTTNADLGSNSAPDAVPTWIQEQIPFFNSKLNDRQKAAVIKILLGQSRPVPYIIFGPPGTGKTMTMVEAILQVFSQMPSSRIIAATPSNSAADLLTDRLIASGVLKESDIVRLNAFNRVMDSIPESIENYCRFGEDLQLISRYRIVVCTCNSAGTLYTLGLKAGHFTHAFVDEAGQATEPECLIPLGLVAGADGQIVLAGDPKQLGPVLMSKFSKMYGMELSFLERLMELQVYSRNEKIFADHGGFDSMLVTMLTNNYRSHPAILTLPSRLFYYDQLEVVADPALTHRLCGWRFLPRADFPVIFHGVRGEDMRESDSPSWFNPMETVQVVQYLQCLLNDPKWGIGVDDIGIITPYRKQVEKIRLLIDKLDVDMVKVGSVEEFQGQERPVIIISTVRANEKLIGFDVRHTLGFLSNPKRFNVSITRAQALLIIVGNPYVLCQDIKWLSLIKYCVESGAYIGCDPPDFKKYQNEADGGQGQFQSVQGEQTTNDAEQ